MRTSIKRPPDIIWIDDQYWRLTPLIEPLLNTGFSYYGIESYREARDNLVKIKEAKLIILDVIIASGDPEINVLERPYLGHELLDYLRNMEINRPVIVFTIVREPKVLNDIQENVNVRGVFRKGESNEKEFLRLAREILQTS
jgi:hypothetical protein